MAGDPVQLRHDDPDAAHAVIHLDPHQLFHCQCVAQVVVHGSYIIHPVSERDHARVIHVLGMLFEAPVEIPDVGNRLVNDLAVGLQFQAQDPVRGRVLRPHVQGH